MNTIPKLSYSLLALFTALTLTLSGCSSLSGREPVNVVVVGVEPLAGEGLEMRLLVTLRVQNPNDTALEYNGVSLRMDVQGDRFATGVSDTAGSVPRFGESLVKVPVSISAFHLARQAMDAFGGSHRGKVAYELSGKLAGPLFRSMAFESRGELALPESWLNDNNTMDQ